MGKFKDHLKNGLNELVLYSSVRQTKFIENRLKEELHFTFDKFELKDETETENEKVCTLMIDFGDLQVSFKLYFEKRVQQVKYGLKLKDKPTEYYAYRLIRID